MSRRAPVPSEEAYSESTFMSSNWLADQINNGKPSSEVISDTDDELLVVKSFNDAMNGENFEVFCEMCVCRAHLINLCKHGGRYFQECGRRTA